MCCLGVELMVMSDFDLEAGFDMGSAAYSHGTLGMSHNFCFSFYSCKMGSFSIKCNELFKIAHNVH